MSHLPNPNYRFQELNEHETFDPCTIIQNAPFTQADFYGHWQRFFKRDILRFIISKENKVIGYFQLIKYPLIGNKNYLYIPYGPVTEDQSSELLSSLKSKLKEIAREMNAVFVRLDFTPSIEPDSANTLKKIGYTKSPKYTYHSSYFQPRAEWFLKLDKTENELYEDMHKDHRYSIRLSERKEIKTEIISSNFTKYLEPFYELMKITSKRNSFSLHPKDYYRSIFENLNQRNAFLVIAKYQEKILAIDLVIMYGDIAHYVFACSSNEERNRAPAFGAIWTCIRHAKSLGFKYFNFGGITTPEDPNPNWEGLTSFKKKFNGFEVKHSPFYDLVFNKLIYRLYNFRKYLKNIF